MSRFSRRRPSPAMAVALLALFLSLGGVSYGVATGSIDSRELRNNAVRGKDVRNNDLRTQDIRNNDIRGRDIRTGAITGADIGANRVTGDDILESSLGLVPGAARAVSAASVDTLKTVGSFKRVASSATDNDPNTARANATEVPLLTSGAFDVYGKCYTDTDAATTFADTFIRTRVNGSVFQSDGGDTLSGNPFLDSGTGTAEADRQVQSESAGTNAANVSFDESAVFGAAAPDGTGLSGETGLAVKNGTLPGGSQGVYGAGNACLFWGHLVK